MLKESPTFSTIRTPSSYPASHKRYLAGNRADVRVPYREITLSDTHHRDHTEANPPVPVYDTSGPYTDPEVGIRLTRGLPALRSDWIKEREDTGTLTGRSSEYAREREKDLLTVHLRFPSPPISRRARSGENLSQMHYARKGIITPEMVDLVGIEPTTSSMPWKRAPSCATGPRDKKRTIRARAILAYLLWIVKPLAGRSHPFSRIPMADARCAIFPEAILQNRFCETQKS
jgi:hypothetical protein